MADTFVSLNYSKSVPSNNEHLYMRMYSKMLLGLAVYSGHMLLCNLQKQRDRETETMRENGNGIDREREREKEREGERERVRE